MQIKKTNELYTLRKECTVAINNVEEYLKHLANSPQNYKKEVASVQESIIYFNQAKKIENEYSSGLPIEAETRGVIIISDYTISKLGPTAAMAIATTFGTNVVSRCDIESNSIFAKLYGVMSEMPAGLVFLTLSNSHVWVLLELPKVFDVGDGICAFWRKNKKAALEAEKALYNIQPIIAELQSNLQELNNLYTETEKLLPALNVDEVCKNFPKCYNEFTEDQKKRLGALINSTKAMGALIKKRFSYKYKENEQG